MKIKSITKISYKIPFTEKELVGSNMTNFLKKYNTPYGLWINFVISKINMSNAKIYHMHLILNLMQGYDEDSLFSGMINACF